MHFILPWIKKEKNNPLYKIQRNHT